MRPEHQVAQLVIPNYLHFNRLNSFYRKRRIKRRTKQLCIGASASKTIRFSADADSSENCPSTIACVSASVETKPISWPAWFSAKVDRNCRFRRRPVAVQAHILIIPEHFQRHRLDRVETLRTAASDRTLAQSPRHQSGRCTQGSITKPRA